MCFRRVSCRGKAQSPIKFDRKGFCDTVYNVRKAYRYRAIALIEICQFFLIAPDQCLDQYAELLRVTTACDEAIRFAIKSRDGKEENSESDHQFEEAVRLLGDYESRFYDRLKLSANFVERKMEDAKGMDKEKMYKLRNEEDLNDSEVEFHILSTLDCEDPVVVPQILGNPSTSAEALSNLSTSAEILWNFSHFDGEKRLTLEQNPHFYASLPTSNSRDVDTFWSEPTNTYGGKIYVLTNNSRRLFLELGSLRVFDHVLDTQNTFIFRNTCGKLEGQKIVEDSIQVSPPYLYRMKHLQDQPEEAQSWREILDKLRESTPINGPVNA